MMAEGWTSDWEKLFSKCLADQEFRTQLLAALSANNDDVVMTMLNSIGAAGEESFRAVRLSALKAARGPMESVASQFGAAPSAAVAP